MDPLESLQRLAVALGIGLLVGLDRERAELRKGEGLVAGIRTLPLVALSGALSILLIDVAGYFLLVATFVAVAGITAIAYARSSASGHLGATTEISVLTTYLLGAVAGAGQFQVAVAGGIAVAVLLVAKPRLQALSRAISEEEIWATLELAVISAIVLPLLPDKGFGPWEELNPYRIWLIVVLVATVSFAGFVAERILGERAGLLATAVLGAIASSTAVTVAMSHRARADPAHSSAPAAAVVLAGSVMCVRVAILSAVIGAGILPRLLPAVIAMALCGAAAAWWISRSRDGVRGRKSEERTSIRNPFSLRSTLVFGAIFALTLLAVRYGRETFGESGTLPIAALSSMVDVDAVSIAFVRGGPGSTDWRSPATAVIVAMVTNTVVKLGIGAAIGRGSFRREVALGLGGMAVAGAAAGAIGWL
ncbi:MAG: MgtC/SapB family protein [Planctomycetota bacterium]